MIYGKDISTWNHYTPGSEDFVMIKMSGGDSGLYFDSKATLNYTTAKNAGKVVGGYHFAGGTDPVAEADYFVRAMSPVAEGDLFALDWEIQHANPVAWCEAFVNEVHAKTGVWCFIYINISTCNAYDWTPVLQNCGLWLAAPSVAYDANAPISHTYVMQQGPIVGGIDQDVFFGTRDQLLAYGYHAPATPAPAPQPTPAPAPTPQPVTKPQPTPSPVVTPAPVTQPVPVVKPPVLPNLNNKVPSPAPKPSLLKRIWLWLIQLL
jgi:hypothetical protein